MSWPYSSAEQHFRMAKEEASARTGRVRTVCGTYVAHRITYELREGQTVDCVPCMLVKDAWLESQPRRPLTVRRCRQFWQERLALAPDDSPIEIQNRAERKVRRCAWCMQPAAATHPECEARGAQEQAQARVAREVAQREATLKAQRALIAQRERAVERLQAKAKRLASNLKRAEKRLKAAQKKLTKLEAAP